MGNSKEYAAAKRWLAKITEAANFNEQSIFMVPGNHDVDATADSFCIGAMVDQLRAKPPKQGRTFTDAWKDDAAITALLERQKNFWDFASGYAAVTRQGTPFNGWWTHDRATEGRSLRIVGINTALLSAKGDAEGPFELGSKQRLDAGDALDADIVILMSHHPFDGGWLKDENNVKATFGKSMILHLSGHIHDAKASVYQDTTGRVRRTIAAGAVHRAGRDRTPVFDLLHHRARRSAPVLAVALHLGRAQQALRPRFFAASGPRYRSCRDSSRPVLTTSVTGAAMTRLNQFNSSSNDSILLLRRPPFDSTRSARRSARAT